MLLRSAKLIARVCLDEEDAARTGKPFGLARPAAAVVSRQIDVTGAVDNRRAWSVDTDARGVDLARRPLRQAATHRGQRPCAVGRPAIDRTFLGERTLRCRNKDIVADEGDGGAMGCVKPVRLDLPRGPAVTADAKPGRAAAATLSGRDAWQTT